ncbi:MAG: hypothetical protein ACKOAH_09415, partial [Pirellula sp.]
MPISDIDAITIQALRGNATEDVSKLASEIFGPAPGADRPAIVREALSRWPSKADTSLGQIAYQKHCAVCTSLLRTTDLLTSDRSFHRWSIFVPDDPPRPTSASANSPSTDVCSPLASAPRSKS